MPAVTRDTRGRAQAAFLGVPAGRRSADRLKIRNTCAAEVLVDGWLLGSGYRASLPGSLLVGTADSARPGVRRQRRFRFAELRELDSLESPASPFTQAVPPSIRRRARWVRPVLEAEVA